ncbi:hypothetical protein MRB53_021872 [Persea americana]|uniref:Uncharacterized protein n=1 Tax=Persea americana TaxID=3435 RepID=A0ACC2L548_PERAE|nr:hypothetical protein MRB53_021872 [Persea americana]
MKFGKEFAAQMVPEWQQAYMDYNMLKNILKDILHYRQQRIPPSPAAGGGGGGLKRKMTMYRAFSGLTRRYSNLRGGGGGGGGGGEEQVILVNSAAADGDGVRSSERYETMFLMATVEGGEYEMVYFKRLDDEFNKVNSFYMSKVQEVMAEADVLTRQMNALIAFRLRVENPSRYHQGFLANSPSPNSGNTIPDLDLLPTPTNTSRLEKAARMDVIQEVEMSSEITEESVIHVDEPHYHKSAPQKKPHKKSSKPAPLEVLDHVKINVALETPRSTIKGMLMDSKCKDLSFSKEELRKAEEQLKRAFVEFYQKLRLLKSYSFLNLLAFSKIMKKYDKITSRSASRSYLNMVDNSYLGSSEEVTRLLERVEETFIKHFGNSNHRKGMITLRPTTRRARHRTTFLLGFVAGCSIALLVALILLVRARNIYNMAGTKVQAIRSLEFYICYYGGGDFKLRQENCSKNDVYKAFFFIVAVIPYWLRFLQCIRRMFEEHDAVQGYNGLKYLTTIIAVVMRTAYEIHKGFHWKIMAGISSILATIVSIYWDIVLDWGLLQKNSKNRWLRDKLLVSHKSVYFAAMVLNILLRFAWLQSVLGIKVSFLHIKALATTFACLEIIRRGIWNFFRLENEHLNNVGKYRAFKSVPLPFNYDTDDEKDE